MKVLRRSRTIACVVLGTIVGLSVALDCTDLTNVTNCEGEGCLWRFEIQTGDLEGVCKACSQFSGEQFLCASTDCTYNKDTGECSDKELDVPPLVEVQTSSAKTRTSEGWAYIELGTTYMSKANIRDFEKGFAKVLGAEQVYIDTLIKTIEIETCGETPLCGDGPQMLTKIDSYEKVPIPQLASCCAIKDTHATKACQENDPTVSHSRVTGMQIPFCPALNIPATNDRCAALQDSTLKEQTSMVLSLAFEKDTVESSCCLTCSCYGDPNCVSFNGTYTSWRLCDGRDLSNKCVITEGACTRTKDHEGNACKWKQGGYSAWWSDGSPCQPDVNAGDAWLLMYQADSYKFEIRQEERGVIREALMITNSGNYSISAESCLKNSDFENSWTFTGPTPESEPNWEMVNGWKRIKEDGLFDVIWFVYDSATAIQTQIRCTGTKNPKKNQYGNYRLNIDALVEPIEDYWVQRSDVEGFCATSSLLTPSSTAAEKFAWFDHLETDKSCKGIERVWLDNEVVKMAQDLCGSGQSAASLNDCYQDFCSENAFPLLTVKTCVDLFRSKDFPKALCYLQFSSKTDIQKCIDDINEFGWENGVTRFRASKTSMSSCISSKDQLPKTLTACQSGVILQYQDIAGDDESWKDYVAFPESIVLCDNQLKFSAMNDLVLFTKPLRFKQSSKPLTCSSALTCREEYGLNAMFEFFWPHTNRPTSSPTEWPTTLSPTFAPTDAPTTAKPTGNPTIPRPTPKPSPAPHTPIPTDWPSSAPSHAPVSKPPSTPSTTNKPTMTPSSAPSFNRLTPKPTEWPTSKPTEWPTSKPTEWPTSKPTPNPTYCTPECETSPGAIWRGKAADPQVCQEDFMFTKATLEAEVDYCGCDFKVTGSYVATGFRSVVDFSKSCPDMVKKEDLDALEMTCELLCTNIRNNANELCNAWAYDHTTSRCSLYACETSRFVDKTGSSGGLPCYGPNGRPTYQPSHAPTTWLESIRGRRLSSIRGQSVKTSSSDSELEFPFEMVSISQQGRSLTASAGPLFKLKYYAIFSDSSEVQEAVLTSNTKTIRDASMVLKTSGSLAKLPLRMVGSSSRKSYKVDDLRFPTIIFDDYAHNSASFLNAVCDALEKTIGRRTSMKSVKCNTKLFMIRSYADENGSLVVLYRNHEVTLGKIQEMLETSAGIKALAEQLSSSLNGEVKVLGASLDSSVEGDSGSLSSTATVIGAVSAVTFVGIAAVGVALKRYHKRRQTSEGDQLWEMVNYYKK